MPIKVKKIIRETINSVLRVISLDIIITLLTEKRFDFPFVAKTVKIQLKIRKSNNLAFI